MTNEINDVVITEAFRNTAATHGFSIRDTSDGPSLRSSNNLTLDVSFRNLENFLKEVGLEESYRDVISFMHEQVDIWKERFKGGFAINYPGINTSSFESNSRGDIGNMTEKVDLDGFSFISIPASEKSLVISPEQYSSMYAVDAFNSDKYKDLKYLLGQIYKGKMLDLHYDLPHLLISPAILAQLVLNSVFEINIEEL